MGEMTHLDNSGQAKMVDVGDKAVTRRTAVASARVRTTTDVIRMIDEKALQKGDVLAVARVAGIMAAKHTSDLIPLCHPIPIESISIDLTLGEDTVEITARADTTAKTGLEMEALTAASVAALTIYDMCKAVDRSMTIEFVRLAEKSGGKSGKFVREQD